jgi:hypothetical protein
MLFIPCRDDDGDGGVGVLRLKLGGGIRAKLLPVLPEGINHKNLEIEGQKEEKVDWEGEKELHVEGMYSIRREVTIER